MNFITLQTLYLNLALALFMFTSTANHAQLSAAAYNFTFNADFFNRGAYFHMI